MPPETRTSPPPAAPAWHCLSPEEVLDRQGSSMDGLTSAEAEERYRRYGPNQIRRKSGDSALQVLWRQINNPLIWVLLGSAALAILLGKMTDGLVVLSVVVVNSIIGFIQEFKAGRAIEALIDMVPSNAAVTRDGRTFSLPSASLVPGDLVMLAAGDSVPADMRLLALKNLQVEEAALTGESVPVEKQVGAVDCEAVLGDRKSMVYSGTLVTSGTASAVVTDTGMDTELGRISELLETAVDLQTPLTRKLAEISTYITVGIIAVSAVILSIGVYRAVGQEIALTAALKDTLVFAIALAVGAIPEGLPAVVTIALAIGVQRMARRHAIIRKLPAVETLGSTTVICSDKTGTLTCNQMTVTELFTANGSYRLSGTGYTPSGAIFRNETQLAAPPEDAEELLTAAVLCNDAGLFRDGNDWAISGDPTEAALLVAAAKIGLNVDGTRADWPRVDVIPFASENQYMVTLHHGKGATLLVKGAPEVVLGRCTMAADGGDRLSREAVMAEVERLGSRGMRVLAVARKMLGEGRFETIEGPMIAGGFAFLGLVGMIDPPREEAVAAIHACHQAGIVVKMITGDHATTALAIGAHLRLADVGKAVAGGDLAAMDDATLLDTARQVNIFARVAPEHKLRLVKALQEDSHVVAMTGDGVNDAPSLKQANIGVAMGITGTAVSKESADIVLADDNFASISAAVEEGRRVYDNLIKSLAFLLPTNLGLALILIYGIMFFPFDPVSKALLLPMQPTQLLWINLVAAIALALPLAFEVMEPDIMRRPPRRPNAPLFSGFVVFRVIAVSLAMTAGTIVLFSLEYDKTLAAGVAAPEALARSQTMAVTFVIMFQIFYMLHCRSLNAPLTNIGLFSNPVVFWGIGTILALQALLVYLPLMQRIFGTAALLPADIALAVTGGFLIFPLISIEKHIRSRLTGRRTDKKT